MKRRTVLISMLSILGVSESSTSFAEMVDGMRAYKKSTPSLNSKTLEVIKIIGDIVFPQTDTPSASHAGVHLYIDFFTQNFFSEDRRSHFFEALEKQIGSLDSFLRLDAKAQHNTIKIMDDTLGGDNEVEVYRELKNLLIVAFFSSEVGAKQVLKYDPVPGSYSEIPMREIGRAWF